MTVKDYMQLPYHRVLQKITDESGTYFFATVSELDGCMTDGETVEEAHQNLDDAMEGWIACKLEGGFAVPMPSVSLRVS